MAICMADIIIANSRWTAELSHEIFGILPEILYPTINPKDTIPEIWDPDYILFMARGKT